MIETATPPAPSRLRRAWQYLMLWAEAAEMTEASVLAERVTALEREVARLRGRIEEGSERSGS